MEYQLRIIEKDYEIIKEHLYPGDGNEAVAVALCGRHTWNNIHILVCHKVITVPYSKCEIRRPDFIKWSTEILLPLLPELDKKNFALLKIHSHPGGFQDFSMTDDNSDRDLFDSVYGWTDSDLPHSSAIMLPSGEMFGRVVTPQLQFIALSKISVIGNQLKFWTNKLADALESDFALRTKQTFGEGTTKLLAELTIAVIGCSGTGSPTIEQLVRLGVGHIILVDPDYIETKNIGRIYNSNISHVGKYKVDVLKNHILNIGIGTKVTTYAENLYDSNEAINATAAADIIVGCVDSVDGRHLLNQISTFYLVSYLDLGVKIIADGKGGVDQICGTVHFIQPGGSSLRTRGLYSNEDLRSAAMYRTDKTLYEEQKKMGYIVNLKVESPAVISLNTLASSLATNELLARIHPYRNDDNSFFAIRRFSLTDSFFQNEGDGEPDPYLIKFVGRGKMNPPLNMTEFGT